MSTSENSKSGMFPSVMGSSPMITSEKLHGASNYKSWAASVRLWFKGQGHLDHLHKKETDIPVTDRPNWIKLMPNYVLCCGIPLTLTCFPYINLMRPVMRFGTRQLQFTVMILDAIMMFCLILSILSIRIWTSLLM